MCSLVWKVMLKLGNWACRKEKDPLKPKHPTTAFFAFSNSRRPALLEAKKPVTEVPTWLFVNFVLEFYAPTNVCALSVLPCCFWTSFKYLDRSFKCSLSLTFILLSFIYSEKLCDCRLARFLEKSGKLWVLQSVHPLRRLLLEPSLFLILWLRGNCSSCCTRSQARFIIHTKVLVSDWWILFSASALTCRNCVTSPYVLLITITQIAAKDKERYALEYETYKKNKAEVSFSNQSYNLCMHLVLIIWHPRGLLSLPKFICFHHLYTCCIGYCCRTLQQLNMKPRRKLSLRKFRLFIYSSRRRKLTRQRRSDYVLSCSWTHLTAYMTWVILLRHD